jgi:hypothetical protein
MMMTDTERLQFVIRFAQMDLDTLRPGDWLNLKDDVGWFLTGSVFGHNYPDDEPVGGDMEIRPLDPPYLEDYPQEAFRVLQEETLHILKYMIIERGAWAPIPIQIRLAAPSLDGLIPVTGQHLLIAEGPTRDAFLLRMLMLMARHPTNRIRRCPECDAIFYRVGKQQYCSRVCVNRATVRTWRQRAEVQIQEQERAHQRYVSKHAGAQPKRNPRPRKPVATKR